MRPFPRAVGSVLREVRQQRGLTLREVQARSRGRFKPSALGGYERGARGISLERFCELAAVYGVPPDRLLARVLESLRPETRQEVVLDLNRMRLILGDERRAVNEFIQSVRLRRGDFESNVITLRSGDLEAIALQLGEDPRSLLKKLAPALRGESGRGRREAEPR